MKYSHLHVSSMENELPLPFPASSKESFPKCFVPQFTKKEAMGTRADADLVSIDSYWASGFSWSCLCWEMTLRSWGQQGNIVYFLASELLCNLSSKFWCLNWRGNFSHSFSSLQCQVLFYFCFYLEQVKVLGLYWLLEPTGWCLRTKAVGKAYHKFLLILKNSLIPSVSLKDMLDSTKIDGTGETKLLVIFTCQWHPIKLNP